MSTKKSKQRKSKSKRTARPRVTQRPDALAFTIGGFQAIGGCGKTMVYELAKDGTLEVFKDPIGRTLITGKSARRFLGIEEDTVVA